MSHSPIGTMTPFHEPAVSAVSGMRQNDGRRRIDKGMHEAGGAHAEMTCICERWCVHGGFRVCGTPCQAAGKTRF